MIHRLVTFLIMTGWGQMLAKITSKVLKNRDFSKKIPVWVGSKIRIPPSQRDEYLPPKGMRPGLVTPSLDGGGHEISF